MRGKCRLCGSDAELQRSHIIPAFVFRWLRESSATGHIRLGDEPNRRVQDGWWRRWLCPCCENLLGSTERQFSQQIFRPVVEDRLEHIKYGHWLLKFCVSLSWRVLCWFQDEDQFDDYSEEDRTLLDQTTITWKKYLLGHSADILGTFRQHINFSNRISFFG